MDDELGNPTFSALPVTADEKEEGLLQVDDHGNRKKAPGSASLFSCIMNLANTILGAGMLGLPHAFASNGYALGIILLFVFAILAAFGLHLLAMISLERFSEKRDASFYKVATAAFSKGALAIDAAVAIKCFGVGTSYLIVIGDLLPPAFEDMGAGGLVSDRRFLITLLMGVVVVPLCCLKNMDAMRFTSTLSICFVVFITCVIFSYAVHPGDICDGKTMDDCKGPTENFIVKESTVKVLTIFIFGYTCHQNIFTICNELNQFTATRINTVIGSSVGSGLIVYLIIAISGYATFGSKVASDVLELYPQDTLMTVSRILVSLLVISSFPLQCFPCRQSVMSILDSTIGPAESEWLKNRRWWVITGLICTFAWLISMVVKDLGIVLAIVGATGSTTISYILPGFVYYSLQKEWTVKRGLALALFIFGCCVIPTALTIIFI